MRSAIRSGRLSFPAQLPVFEQTRGDIQWRLVGLYILHGWSCPRLGRRYGLSCARVEQLIHDWLTDAAHLGYLARIPAGPGEAIELDPASLKQQHHVDVVAA